jgi:hypothetical protein
LSNLKDCPTDLITVTDAHGIVRQSFDREILAELSVGEITPSQVLLPVAIRFDLIDENSSLLAPVSRQIALAVSIEI